VDFRYPGLGAGFVFGATGRAADAARADNFMVTFDRYAAGQRQDIGD
jgi:hypothetical protein